MIDYELSIQKLIKHISYLRNEKKREEAFRPPTRMEKKIDLALSYPSERYQNFHKFKLETLATQLSTTLKMLEHHGYEFELEYEFDADPIELDFQGYRIPLDPADSRLGSYKHLLWELRLLIEVCNKKIDESRPLPNYAREAARGLLHIMYNCEKDRPTLYDRGEDVQELKRICDSAGANLSPERLRGLLAEELNVYDPLHTEYDDFLVYKQ